MSELSNASTYKDDAQISDELKSLFATLVRAHFLDKSPHFQSALDFERLFRLDELKELHHLERLRDLKALDQLGELQLLEKLDRLKDLRGLDRLDQLDQLKHIAKLEELKQLSQLDRLLSLSSLDSLKQLEKLIELKNLEKLDQLAIINLLEETLRTHQDVLLPLHNMSSLSELKNLSELTKLERLHDLSKLDKLEKLDRLDDTKFAVRLDKLDKLDILKQESRKLVVSQVIGVVLEVSKFLVAIIIAFLLITSERGQRWLDAGLSSIGSGGASRVNLGLKLIASSAEPAHLVQVLEDVRLKVQENLKLIFTNDPFVSPRRRLEVLGEITSYRFEKDGYELQDEILDSIKEKQKKLQLVLLKQLDFELAQAKSSNDQENENNLREIKLLLKDDRFAQVFNKAYPLWRKSEALNLAVIFSMIELYLLDPKSLGDYL